jgi:hypothetical protein
MGKYRGGHKPWEKNDPKGRRLDSGQYPELNAVFYGADPAEFIKMRIESLSLMACSDEQLTPAFSADRVIGTARFGAMDPPALDARKRYIRMESVMIAHHASEALLRLFFAHVEHEECPWLGMSASTDFGEFKAKVAAALQRGFDRAQIAMTFPGGASPTEACIQPLSLEQLECSCQLWSAVVARQRPPAGPSASAGWGRWPCGRRPHRQLFERAGTEFFELVVVHCYRASPVQRSDHRPARVM